MNPTPDIDLSLIQFLIAVLIGLGSLGIFIWAVLSGMFRDVEEVKMRAYRAEVPDDDDPDDQARPAR
ncbi:MAG TPA: hypothetical protein PL143_13185 [Rhodocyclaceae bacterium]|nr:hypothetical protein [Rhodocyclaceae bacterium]